MPTVVEADYVYWTDTQKPFIKDYITEKQVVPSYYNNDLDEYRRNLGDDFTKAMVKAIGHAPATVYPWEENQDARLQQANEEAVSPTFVKDKAKWKKKYNKWFAKWKQKPTHLIRQCEECDKLLTNKATCRASVGDKCGECAVKSRGDDIKNGTPKILCFTCDIACPRCEKKSPVTIPIHKETLRNLSITCQHCRVGFRLPLKMWYGL